MNKKQLSDRYQITKEVGRGAMGVVYQAWDPKACREVAIKVLLSEHVGKSEYLERFEREGRAMGQLAHNNIVRLFDVGSDGDDHYLVMEYFPSKNLAQIIFEQGLLSETEVLNIALQIAEGLSFAHEKGIIHRDIKPGNIMMDQTGHVKIADFGIAKIKQSSRMVASSLTAVGAVLGTEKYMSPEQADAASIDGQSDLYSLGVVISELLTGKRKIFADPETLKIGDGLPKKEDPQEISIQVKRLLKALLQKDRVLRVSDAASAVKMIKAILSNKNPSGFFLKVVSIVVAFVFITGGSFYFLSEEGLLGFDVRSQVENKKNQAVLEKKRIAEEQLEEQKRLVVEEKKRVAEAQQELALAREKQIAAEKKRIAAERLEEKKRLVVEEKKRLVEEQQKPALAREKQIVAEKKRLTEAKEKRLAEEIKQEALAKAAKNGILFVAQDLRRLKRRLKVLEEAYENKALSRLESISHFSPGTVQLLERIFETYVTVDVSVSQPRVKGDIAEFIISIERLTRQNGITNYASTLWKNRKVIIKKKEGKWGKFEW